MKMRRWGHDPNQSIFDLAVLRENAKQPNEPNGNLGNLDSVTGLQRALVTDPTPKSELRTTNSELQLPSAMRCKRGRALATRVRQALVQVLVAGFFLRFLRLFAANQNRLFPDLT